MPTCFIIICVAFVIFEVIRATYTNNNKVDKSDYEDLQHQLRLAQEENIRILSKILLSKKKSLVRCGYPETNRRD
jgi:hypothetical protein